MSDCPGKSQIRCHRCDECHNMFAECGCHDAVSESLANLFDSLMKTKRWVKFLGTSRRPTRKPR